MTRMVKDYVEIGDRASLDDLIARLTELRDALPAGSDAEVRMRGDDVFGRHLCVAFMRPLNADEADCEARYSEAGKLRFRKAA
jgi:hypothetical protein